MLPVGHKVLVIPKKEKVKKGIIVIGNVEESNKGVVVKTGTAVDYIKEGAEVMYYNNVGIVINYNGKDHIMLGCGNKNSEIISFSNPT